MAFNEELVPSLLRLQNDLQPSLSLRQRKHIQEMLPGYRTIRKRLKTRQANSIDNPLTYQSRKSTLSAIIPYPEGNP
jgi:hypothetical protein